MQKILKQVRVVLLNSLKFLNIIDSQNRLSVSNISLMSSVGITLYVVLIGASILQVLAAFGLTTVLAVNYGYKRYISLREPAHTAEIARLQKALGNLEKAAEQTKKDNEQSLKALSASYNEFTSDIEKKVNELESKQSFAPKKVGGPKPVRGSMV